VLLAGHSFSESRFLDGQPDIDDEYGLAGVQDPKVLITTSRDPSSRLAQFAKVCGGRVFFEGVHLNPSLFDPPGNATRLSQRH